MSSYPLHPSLPAGSSFPQSLRGSANDHCPVCNARWVTCRHLCKEVTYLAGGGGTSDVRPYPHIAYGCGGEYAELPDNPAFWGGRCYGKAKQLEIVFPEQAASF